MTDDEYAEHYEDIRSDGPDPRDYDDNDEYDEVYDEWAEEVGFPP